MLLQSRRLIFLSLVSILLLAALPACTGQAGYDLTMLPMGQMPAEVQSAPASVRQSYRYAAANPDIMKQIPCYCGCGAVGHTSNYSCYVQSVDVK